MNLLDIIFKIRPTLEKNECIHAMWLEGSYATGGFTEDSDIDVWLDVEDDAFQEAADVFEDTLKEAGVLREVEPLAQYSEEPKLAKAKFYLNGKTDDQRVELDIQSHERQFTFSRAEHAIVVLFDKDQTIQWKD